MTREAKLIISGDSARLGRALGTAERQVAGFSGKAISAFQRVGQTIGSFGDRYLTRFNSLLGGAALLGAGKQVIDFDAKLARLTIQAGRTGEGFIELKKMLFEVGKATHQDPGALLEGIGAIVERTGNYDFAIQSIKDLGIVASATGASVADIGATASNLQEKMGITSGEIMTVFDVLNAQGKKGSFTLENMAAMFERLLTSASGIGVQGVDGMRRFGAFLQIARRGAGSSEQATTSVERTIDDLVANREKISRLVGYGIFDDAGNMTKGLDQTLKDVVVKTKGNTTLIAQIFGVESQKAIKSLAASWKKFGDFREFDAFVETGGDGVQMMKDFAFWSEQSKSKIGDFMTQLKKFSNENLAWPIEKLTDTLTVLNEHPALTSTALYTVLGLGAAAVGQRVIGGVGGMLWKRGAPAGAGGAAGGGALGGLGAPVPVYVVNQPLSVGGAGGAAGKAAGGLTALGRAGLAGAVAAGAYMGMSAILEKTGWDKKLEEGAKESGFLDATIGRLFDWKYGTDREQAKDFNKQWKTGQTGAQNPINIEVVVEKDGRHTAKVNAMDVPVDTRVKRRGAQG